MPKLASKPCSQIVKSGGKSAFKTHMCGWKGNAEICIKSVRRARVGWWGWKAQRTMELLSLFTRSTWSFRPGQYVNKLLASRSRDSTKTNRQLNLVNDAVISWLFFCYFTLAIAILAPFCRRVFTKREGI